MLNFHVRGKGICIVGVFEHSAFERSVGQNERGERSSGMLLTLKKIGSWVSGTGWRTRS